MKEQWSEYPPWDPAALDEAFFDLFSSSDGSTQHDLPDSLLWFDNLFPLDTTTAARDVGIHDNCYSMTTEDANFFKSLSEDGEPFFNQDAALTEFGFSRNDCSQNMGHSSQLLNIPTQSAEIGPNKVPFAAHLYKFKGRPNTALPRRKRRSFSVDRRKEVNQLRIVGERFRCKLTKSSVSVQRSFFYRHNLTTATAN